MTRPYRILLAVIACLALGSAAGQTTATYPSKPVILLIPAGPGGSVDKVARIINSKLSEGLGQPVVIDYKPGASGLIAEEALVKAAPDGHTILLDASTVTMNAVLQAGRMRFDVQKDMVPVANMARYQHMLAVSQAVPAKTVAELVAYIKANSGKVNFASAGTGSAQHVLAEMFLRANGIRATNVNYKGGAQQLLALASGEVEFGIFGVGTGSEMVKSGKIRALAVMDDVRAKALPDTPTMSELGYPQLTSPWTGVFVPRGTPAHVVQRLNQELVKAIRDPSLQDALAVAALPVIASTPAALARTIAEEIEFNTKLVRELNLKPD